MTPRKIILDVDTGSDDAVAIVTAACAPQIDMVAICTCFGNLAVEDTTENTLRVLNALGVKIPVYRGCAGPLVKDLVDDYPHRVRKQLFDENSMPLAMHTKHLNLPQASFLAEEKSAAMFYVDYLLKAESPVTIVIVGAMTNFALALRITPEIIRNVDEIVIMGGGHLYANARPCAEANIWVDPDAAQIVLNCGAKVTMIPLDATHEACITKEDCERFRSLRNFAGTFCAEQIEQRIKVHTLTQPLHLPNSAAVHDPLCIAYLIDPSVITDIRPAHVDIGQGGPGEGQTIIDMRYYTSRKNCYFAFHADRIHFAKILFDSLAHNQSTPVER